VVTGVFTQPLLTFCPEEFDLSRSQQSAGELQTRVSFCHIKIAFISIKQACEKGKKLHWGHFYCITTTQV